MGPRLKHPALCSAVIIAALLFPLLAFFGSLFLACFLPNKWGLALIFISFAAMPLEVWQLLKSGGDSDLALIRINMLGFYSRARQWYPLPPSFSAEALQEKLARIGENSEPAAATPRPDLLRYRSESSGFVDASGIETVVAWYHADELDERLYLQMKSAAKFAARGIPMHCDKPCGESMEPYASLVETCRKKSIPFQIGYMYRGNPAVKWIWENVAKGIVGDVAFVEIDMNHDYGSAGYAEYLSSFKSGILYNLGCHLVDLVLPVVRGELKETHVFVGPASGDPPWATTSGAAFLRFGGTDAVVRTSSHMPGALMTRRLRIDGTLGTIDLCPIERFDGEAVRLTLTRKGEKPQEIAFGVQTDRYAAQLLELAAIVRGERPNDQDYDRDLKVHETTLRMCEL